MDPNRNLRCDQSSECDGTASRHQQVRFVGTLAPMAGRPYVHADAADVAGSVPWRVLPFDCMRASAPQQSLMQRLREYLAAVASAAQSSFQEWKNMFHAEINRADEEMEAKKLDKLMSKLSRKSKALLHRQLKKK